MKMGAGVSTTPPPLYPRERPGTLCTGDWVGTGYGLLRNLRFGRMGVFMWLFLYPVHSAVCTVLKSFRVPYNREDRSAIQIK